MRVLHENTNIVSIKPPLLFLYLSMVLYISPTFCSPPGNKSQDIHDKKQILPLSPSSESWDGPVMTVEREESIPVQNQPQDDHKFQKVEEDDRFHEKEEIEQNRVLPIIPKRTDDVPSPNHSDDPSSATRFGAAGAVVFAVALLIILDT